MMMMIMQPWCSPSLPIMVQQKIGKKKKLWFSHNFLALRIRRKISFGIFSYNRLMQVYLEVPNSENIAQALHFKVMFDKLYLL